MQKVDWHKNHADNKKLSIDSYKTTKNVRRYFEPKFGEPSKFNRDFMHWIKNAAGLTMGAL